MIIFILGLICFALGCINISLGVINKANWTNIIVGLFCLTVGIYDIVTFVMKLI
jgi:hypothetical protein